MCIRRDHLGDRSARSGHLALQWEDAVDRLRVSEVKFNETDQVEPVKLDERFWHSPSLGHWKPLQLGKKTTTCMRTLDWPLPSCRILGESGGLPCTLVLFSDE